MRRTLENSTTTPRDKNTVVKLRHIGNQKFSRRKTVFWTSLERKHMIYDCDVRRNVYDINLNAKEKNFFAKINRDTKPSLDSKQF